MMAPADLDVVTIGSCFVELASPEPGVSVGEARSLLKYTSGAATIAALGMRRLGARVGVISKVGDDELGQGLIAHLDALGIDTSHIGKVAGQLTSVSLAWADGRGAKTFYFYRFPGYCDPMTAIGEADVDDDYLSRCRVFDFAESAIRKPDERRVAFYAAERARALGKTVVYACNLRKQAWGVSDDEIIAAQREAVRRADIALMNADEARFIAGASDARAAASSLRSLGDGEATRVVIATDGAGAIIVAEPAGVSEMPAFQVPVVYDIGAGDTFHAGYVAAHLRGLPPRDCARHAAAAAALKISTSADPDDLPTWEAVEAFVAAH
jgi:sugar/nucleoside kinase (ribokinase family)